MSAIPWVGQDIVEFIWGGFSVNNATLNRFFSLHFVLPFVLAALALMHLIVLHDTAGSGNPLGVSGNYERIAFAPYYLFKDLITIFAFMFTLSLFVFFMPNILGDSENYVMANPMQTPAAIVPEWYLLPFYAILRSIPNKLIGVIAMFAAILTLLMLPFVDLGRSRGIQFRPSNKAMFFAFVAVFWVLMQLGAKHVESPFIEFGQLSTGIYFIYFLLTVVVINLLDNTFVTFGRKAYAYLPMAFMPFIELKDTMIQNDLYINVSIALCILLALVSSIILYKRIKSRSTYTMLGGSEDNPEVDGPNGGTSDSEQDGDGKPTQNPVPGRRCPACLERGDTVWVIPGKCCPQCGTPVN